MKDVIFSKKTLHEAKHI